jgi:tetratricopeptide (TPR) repeat protein
MELANRYLNDATLILRKVLGPDLIETLGTFYQIKGQSLVWTDLDACSSLVREAENQGCTTQSAVSLLEEAHGYFARGMCLEDESEQWCHSVRADAERLQRQCQSWLAEAYEARGLFWQAGEIYRTMTRTWNEDALRQWLQMLLRQGQYQEAFQCYQDIKAAWEAQGIKLSGQAKTLFTQIEQHQQRVTITLIASPEPLALAEHAPSRWSAEAQNILSLPGEETLADNGNILYDGLEVEVMAMVLHWRRSSGPIAVLQQLTSDAIKKYDMSKDQHHHDTQLTRRQALQAIAFFPIQMYGLSHLAPPSKPIPLDETLASCAAGVTACWELRHYEPEGLQAIQHILSAYLPTLEQVAHQPSPFQQAAANLAAQGYLLVGILANHYSKLDQMELASRRAYTYGQLARDPNLQASALIRLAVKLDFEEQDKKTLETYQEALALPDFAAVSPLLQGRVYAGLAGMYGYCQQSEQALSYLSQAKEIFPADPTSDPSHPIAICDVNSLVLWEGLTLQYVGRYKDATEAFARVGSLTPIPGILETHRAENLTYASSLAIQQQDLDAATLYLDTADDIAWTIRHTHLREEVRETFKSMRLLWPQEAKVKQFQEKLYAR